ncbi:hypothetical protein CFP56_011213 [Quercus suber]|uniref:PORR domain-containing protein n=1 Tax=Quercus suber TaxID=58331 RepID=A0AAW0MCW2_QUESU
MFRSKPTDRGKKKICSFSALSTNYSEAIPFLLCNNRQSEGKGNEDLDNSLQNSLFGTGIPNLTVDYGEVNKNMQPSFTIEERRHDLWLLSLSDCIQKRFWVEKENAWRLKEWQMLPYTSLHSDVSHLDLDPDVCKKRIGVFHELLHFTA